MRTLKLATTLMQTFRCQPWKKFKNKALRQPRIARGAGGCSRSKIWRLGCESRLLACTDARLFLGIDSAQFSTNSVIDNQRIHNLGSSASVTLNIPIWNWGATQSKVKQAELQYAQAQRELSLAQRKLIAEMRTLYGEAETALNELEDLQRSADLASESLRLARSTREERRPCWKLWTRRIYSRKRIPITRMGQCVIAWRWLICKH